MSTRQKKRNEEENKKRPEIGRSLDHQAASSFCAREQTSEWCMQLCGNEVTKIEEEMGDMESMGAITRKKRNRDDDSIRHERHICFPLLYQVRAWVPHG